MSINIHNETDTTIYTEYSELKIELDWITISDEWF